MYIIFTKLISLQICYAIQKYKYFQKTYLFCILVCSHLENRYNRCPICSDSFWEGPWAIEQRPIHIRFERPFCIVKQLKYLHGLYSQFTRKVNIGQHCHFSQMIPAFVHINNQNLIIWHNM